MGLLINGAWQEHEPETTKDGHFERGETSPSATGSHRTGGPDQPDRMASGPWQDAIICMSRSPAPGRTGH